MSCILLYYVGIKYLFLPPGRQKPGYSRPGGASFRSALDAFSYEIVVGGLDIFFL